MEPPLKRPRVFGHDNPAEIYERRARIDFRLKSTFESIFEKYGKDFSGIGDEIDIETGKIVVNHGHVLCMRDEMDPGRPEDLYDELNSDEESCTPIRRLKRTKSRLNRQTRSTRRIAPEIEAAAQDVDDLGIDFPDMTRRNLLQQPGPEPVAKGDPKVFYKSRHSYPSVSTDQQQQKPDPFEDRQAADLRWRAPPLPKKIKAVREAVSASPFPQPEIGDERSPSPTNGSIWACTSSEIYLETPNGVVSEKSFSIVSRGNPSKVAKDKPEDHIRVQPVEVQSPQAKTSCPVRTCRYNPAQTRNFFTCKDCKARLLNLENGLDRPVSSNEFVPRRSTRRSNKFQCLPAENTSRSRDSEVRVDSNPPHRLKVSTIPQIEKATNSQLLAPKDTWKVPKKKHPAKIGASPAQQEIALRSRNSLEAEKYRVPRENIPESRSRKFLATGKSRVPQNENLEQNPSVKHAQHETALKSQQLGKNFQAEKTASGADVPESQARKAHASVKSRGEQKETLSHQSQNPSVKVSQRKASLRSRQKNGDNSSTGEPTALDTHVLVPNKLSEDSEDSEDELSKPLTIAGTTKPRGTPMPAVAKLTSSSFNAFRRRTLPKRTCTLTRPISG